MNGRERAALILAAAGGEGFSRVEQALLQGGAKVIDPGEEERRRVTQEQATAEAVKRGAARRDGTRYLDTSERRGYYRAADGSIRKALSIGGRKIEHNNGRRRRARKAGK